MIDAFDLQLRLGGTAVLSGAGLITRPGQMVGLVGPNGSGKSSLLRCLYGMLRPHGGAVLVDDRPLDALSRRSIARAIAVVTQETSTEGLTMSVGEFVLLGRHVHRGDHQGFTSDDRRVVVEALVRVGLGSMLERGVHELSGGERQRVMIARCLAQQSKVMLLDEPTNHLDIRYQHEVLALIRSLGLATIVVLHDLNLANRYCDQVVLLDRGCVVASGSPDTVLCSAILEPVFGVEVRRLVADGTVHLALGPLPTA